MRIASQWSVYSCKCSINPIPKIFYLVFHSLFAIKYPKNAVSLSYPGLSIH